MSRNAIWGILVVLLLGCDERERLTFVTDPEDTLGPTSRIDPPSRDTTLTAGDPFGIGVRAVDTSGVDSVFIAIDGADLSFPPIEGNAADTVAFSITLPTFGLGGRTITVRVFGKDVNGHIGPTVARSLTIE
jgi:hypothetical protein